MSYGATTKRARRSSTSGFTLVELLIVLVMTVILASAISYAFAAGVKLQELQKTRDAKADETQPMEHEMTTMLEGAWLSASATDTNTYFQGLTTTGSSELGCNQITFTTTAPGVPIPSIVSQDDFETQQTNLGPAGGVSEVSFETTAVGDAGAQTGLFERIQHPSDADPTQGGYETLLNSQIATIGYKFWDGLEWDNTWDTTQANMHHLPEAVQISYTLKDDTANTVHMFVVPLQTSDVTPTSPVSQGSSS